MRKYSIPFPLLNNDETVDEFMDFFTIYQSYIANVYLGVPDIDMGFHNYKSDCMLIKPADMDEKIADYDAKIYEFLRKSKGIFKRIVTLNSGCYFLNYSEMCEYVHFILIPLLDKYEIDGCICTDYNMACMIHEARPELEMNTSCNGFIWTKREMDMWYDNAGVTVFNPPREFLRMPEQLKKMRETGYTLKYIVNESCTFGCPQRLNHVMYQVSGKSGWKQFCGSENFLKGVWITPRWQRQLDPYVDIYKLVSRMCSLCSIKGMFLAYLTEDNNCIMDDIVFGGGGKERNFAAFEVPDKLLVCECKHCEECGYLCDKLLGIKMDVLKNIESQLGN